MSLPSKAQFAIQTVLEYYEVHRDSDRPVNREEISALLTAPDNVGVRHGSTAIDAAQVAGYYRYGVDKVAEALGLPDLKPEGTSGGKASTAALVERIKAKRAEEKPEADEPKAALDLDKEDEGARELELLE